MPWAAAAAAVVGIGGAISQSNSAEDAAHAQSEASKNALSESARQFNQARADQMPWMTAGKASLFELQKQMGLGSGRSADEIRSELAPRFTTYRVGNQTFNSMAELQAAMSNVAGATAYEPIVDQAGLDAATQEQFQKEVGSGAAGSPLLRKFTMDDFQNDPVSQASFEFGMSEGEKAVKRMFGSRGLSRSGAAVKAATRFATDYTGTKAGESRDRFVQDQSNLYNKLAGVSGTGQVSATNNANAAMTQGSNTAAMLIGEGNARGAASIAQGNAWAGAANNAGNSIQSAYWLNRAYPTTATGGNATPTSNFYYTGDTAAGGQQYG